MSQRWVTFQVGDIDYGHEIGNPKCTVGWCGAILSEGFPRPCACGGLIHADFGDENYDGDYWLYKKCDKCEGKV